MINSIHPENETRFLLVNKQTGRTVFCRDAIKLSTEILGRIATKWMIFIRLPYIEQCHEKTPDILELRHRLEDVEHLINSSIEMKLNHKKNSLTNKVRYLRFNHVHSNHLSVLHIVQYHLTI